MNLFFLDNQFFTLLTSCSHTAQVAEWKQLSYRIHILHACYEVLICHRCFMFANFDQSYQLECKMKTNSPLLFRQDVIYTNTLIWLDSFWMVKKNTDCESTNAPSSKPLYSRSKFSSLKSVAPPPTFKRFVTIIVSEILSYKVP